MLKPTIFTLCVANWCQFWQLFPIDVNQHSSAYELPTSARDWQLFPIGLNQLLIPMCCQPVPDYWLLILIDLNKNFLPVPIITLTKPLRWITWVGIINLKKLLIDLLFQNTANRNLLSSSYSNNKLVCLTLPTFISSTMLLKPPSLGPTRVEHR
jgi:hypothetical protein